MVVRRAQFDRRQLRNMKAFTRLSSPIYEWQDLRASLSRWREDSYPLDRAIETRKKRIIFRACLELEMFGYSSFP